MLTFGKTIRSARSEIGISLRQLARFVELSPSYLSRLENDCLSGKAGPTEATCRKLASVLSLDPDALIALAGRVPGDVAEIIRSSPLEWSKKIRSNQ